jgi:hypothetical protein
MLALRQLKNQKINGDNQFADLPMDQLAAGRKSESGGGGQRLVVQ